MKQRAATVQDVLFRQYTPQVLAVRIVRIVRIIRLGPTDAAAQDELVPAILGLWWMRTAKQTPSKMYPQAQATDRNA